MSEIDLEAIGKRVQAAHTLVGELASGEQRWKMTIPADPARDSDLILSAAPAKTSRRCSPR